MELTVQEAIDALGGRMQAKKLLGVPYTTIDYWYQENRVPVWRRSIIEQHLNDGKRLKPTKRKPRKTKRARISA
jgi:hypothetical protein